MKLDIVLVRVMAISCDGLKANQAMLRCFGVLALSRLFRGMIQGPWHIFAYIFHCQNVFLIMKIFLACCQYRIHAATHITKCLLPNLPLMSACCPYHILAVDHHYLVLAFMKGKGKGVWVTVPNA